MVGRTIAHFNIIEKLGEGGMGVVYKARDTHLDHFVAIKVLPPEKVADPQRKARFVQEAKAASALNHPDIVTIHDISSDNGHDFIAMEYVAGKTLDQLIPRKGMHLNETLKIAVQIADALSRAHAAGIIHRDLKPGNVMVDEHGLVKVLDFGLAKLTEKAPPSEVEFTQTLKPTTEEGTVVGTAAYMSPEQAEAKSVDARSDIFSFGAVLYEMLTGNKAFRGDSAASTMAAVLNQEPAPLGAEVPHDVERIVTRCLRKSPDRRYQHLADVKVELEDLKEESDSGGLAAQPARVARRKARLQLLAAAALLVLAVGGWFTWRGLKAPLPAPRVVPLTAYTGMELYPAFSPDGRQVAFTWDGEKRDNEDTHIWQFQAGAAPQPVLSSTRWDGDPAYSPDGKRVAFSTTRSGKGSELWVANADGTNPMGLTEGNGRMLGSPRWSPDSRWIVFDGPQSGNTHIFVISAEGGAPRRLTHPGANHVRPSWSGDGKWIYFGSNRSGDWQVWKVPAQGGDEVQLTRQGGREAFESPEGRLLFYAKYEKPGIWSVPVDGGEERQVLDKAGQSIWAVARHGICFFAWKDALHPLMQLYSFRDRRSTTLYEFPRGTILGGGATALSVSPDERWILYTQIDQSGSNLVLVDNFR